MGRIKGITVTLINKIEVGKDPLNSPIYEEKKIQVENVLVSPLTTDEITNSLNLYGKKIVYTLAIPKGDKNEWENQEVIFFNKKFKTFGSVTEGIEDMIPLNWNKKVMVCSYE
jgi:hypothetical protein|nr:MAG TPA: Minor capsid protein [Caudoviricetes sp.]